MLRHIDAFLNKITMYRLTLYSLIAIWSWAVILAFFKVASYNPFGIMFAGAVIFTVCVVSNYVFAWLYKAPSNTESVYITAFILMLIISPLAPLSQLSFLVLASVLAMAAKYILVINRKHIFNPAAIAVVITALTMHQYAAWWIGTLYIAPVVFIAGILITRKIQRADLVLSFLIVSFCTITGYAILYHQNLSLIIRELIFNSPWFFLSFIMLTEPATTPPTRKLRIWYGALVGFFFAPFVHIGSFFFSPELALVTGNAFSYFVSPKEKLLLTLKEKIKIANNAVEFVFHPNKPLRFAPGQYMEWTLPHTGRDNRGMRRYFTIASSPTEKDIMLGIKFYENPSSYKKALQNLSQNQVVVASQLAGDFTMPKDTTKKLIFIAGGIGVTPFRSMVKYLMDKNEKRDIVMLYANTSNADIAYKEIFDQAKEKIGLNIQYIEGHVSKEMILAAAPDYANRMFYISGPKSMVDAFKKTLNEMGIPKNHIKTDFFPGFA